MATGLFVTAWLTSLRVRNYERGKPDNRRTNRGNVHRRMRDFRRGVWMRTLLRDPAAGVMHSMIYFGFLVLFIATVLLEIDHQLPDSLKFLHGRTYQAYAFTADVFGLVFLAGITWAFVRRYAQRPYRIRIKTKPEHLVILSDVRDHRRHRLRHRGVPHRGAARRPPGRRASFEKWSFVGWAFSSIFDGWHAQHAARPAPLGVDASHVIAFLAFLVILPTTMLRHMITSPMNMYLKDRPRPKGAMREMPNLMETELETFGASTVEDFTWKQLFDTDACTICGRCTSVCPAHATGKPLDPREIVNKTGEVMALTGTPPVSPPVGIDREITVTADSLFERITAEELWSCTSCKACDEICPVNIEILDKILDMRRYLSLMESNFPASLGNVYRSMENSGNVYGMNQGERGDWADSLEGVEIVEPGGDFDHEYLYWVGCAGSFDDRNKKTSRAMAKLLPARRHRLRDPRPERDVHRRQRPALGQRVHLPDARDAEHRDARRPRREEDHHAVPALLQHAEERVPAARRPLRGDPPLRVPDAADLRRAPVDGRRVARRAGHVPRLLLPRPPQRRVPRAAQGDRLARRHRHRRDAAQRHAGHVLRRRRRAHVDGGDDRQEGQHRARAGGASRPAPSASRSRARSAT